MKEYESTLKEYADVKNCKKYRRYGFAWFNISDICKRILNQEWEMGGEVAYSKPQYGARRKFRARVLIRYWKSSILLRHRNIFIVPNHAISIDISGAE